jgi:hypothetical protein
MLFPHSGRPQEASGKEVKIVDPNVAQTTWQKIANGLLL